MTDTADADQRDSSMISAGPAVQQGRMKRKPSGADSGRKPAHGSFAFLSVRSPAGSSGRSISDRDELASIAPLPRLTGVGGKDQELDDLNGRASSFDQENPRRVVSRPKVVV
jgi:hypothetical protein